MIKLITTIVAIVVAVTVIAFVTGILLVISMEEEFEKMRQVQLQKLQGEKDDAQSES